MLLSFGWIANRIAGRPIVSTPSPFVNSYNCNHVTGSPPRQLPQAAGQAAGDGLLRQLPLLPTGQQSFFTSLEKHMGAASGFKPTSSAAIMNGVIVITIPGYVEAWIHTGFPSTSSLIEHRPARQTRCDIL